jgi:hypothetical protein
VGFRIPKFRKFWNSWGENAPSKPESALEKMAGSIPRRLFIYTTLEIPL